MKHDLSKCGDACNCVKCNPNKTMVSPSHPVDSLFAMYRKCRAAIVKSLQRDGTSNSAIAQYLTLTTETIKAFIDCVDKNDTGSMLVLDIPQYMFKERPVTPITWIELQEMSLDVYMLSDGTALLTDPVTREYCYVFWDEAQQASNPYPTHAEAVNALLTYIL